MDFSTRIPKATSALKMVSSATEGKTVGSAKVNALPPRVQLRPALRRRSKSVTDLRPNSKPLATLGRQFRRPENPPAPKIGQKRPALQKNDEGNKPKVLKVKIPDWDYKARFLESQKKYTSLKDEMNAIKPKIVNLPSMEAELEQLRNQTLEDQAELEKVRENESRLTQFNEKLCKENFSIKNKMRELEAVVEEKKNEYDKLEKNATLLQTTLSKTDAELTALKEIHATLENAHGDTTKSLADAKRSLCEHQTLNAELQATKIHLENKNAALESLTEQLKQELEEHENLRRVLHNTIQDMKGNIRVFCRVRPPVTSEENEKQLCSIFFPTDATMEIKKSRESVSVYGTKGQELKQEFTFDKVFPPEANQAAVFEELGQLVQSALDGYHVCVFAYGQTGSGKTYTMQGSSDDHGMIPRTIDLIFEKIKKLQMSDWAYTVEASFLEIYNENIKDLLVPESTHNYELRYNEGRGVTVTNLTTTPIRSALELKDLMDVAQKNRAVAATDFNDHSSRSHAVAKINLEGYNSATKAIYAGSINLVDLAGSESAKTSSAERLIETKNINKSLSTLGSVMLALHNNDPHVPYRNSKLTFLLQSCLGGNSKTLMFVNISPFEECFNESISSLRFAVQVKDVKTVARKNKMYCPTPVSQAHGRM